MVCNKKFLYRDAMFELMSKLQIGELEKKKLESELYQEEKAFEQTLTSLQKVIEERRKNDKQIATERKKKQKETDDASLALEQARAERDHEKNKIKDMMVDKQELLDEERALEKQIQELKQCTTLDAGMIQQLEVEIEGLEDELQEKVEKLRADSIASKS